ncbi:MAG: hypothetical protein IT374_08050 [Polyangiaceae bacterium]|nr:hypothetical protein [Polyangiaceae bacterium]
MSRTLVVVALYEKQSASRVTPSWVSMTLAASGIPVEYVSSGFVGPSWLEWAKSAWPWGGMTIPVPLTRAAVAAVPQVARLTAAERAEIAHLSSNFTGILVGL